MATEPDPNEALAGLMAIAESVVPFIEFAEGQKATLVERGWTPTSADVIARELLVGIIRKLLA